MLHLYCPPNAKRVKYGYRIREEDKTPRLLQSGKTETTTGNKSGVLLGPSNQTKVFDTEEERQGYVIGLSVLTVLHC